MGIVRYRDSAGTQRVGGTAYGYDYASRLTTITQFRSNMSTFATYSYRFDQANRLYYSSTNYGGTQSVNYTYDDAGQLITADWSANPPNDETYQYDANGNRTSGGYTVGENNQMTSDGTYWYLYDDEGNRIAKFIDAAPLGQLGAGDTDITQYTWDHRNRLTQVLHRQSYGAAADKIFQYEYDYANREIRKLRDADGNGTPDQINTFLYDGNQIAVQFDDTTPANATAATDLKHRYLWGAAVDQLLADEVVSSLDNQGTVSWPMGDHLNSVREVVDNNGNSVAHLVYDSFGNLPPGTNPLLFGYTGRPLDADTGLQNNLNRWYDARIGRWLSEDPIAADVNLYRYVSNNPVVYVDPSGLFPQPPQTGKQGLGSQIFEQYIKLAIGGAVVVPQLVTGPLNWFGYHYQFDDDGHVANDTKLARREFLAHLAKSLDVTANGKWWTITRSAWGSIYPHAKDRPGISEDPAIKSRVMQPSFWLGGAHDIEATGQYDVRFCPHPKMNGYTIVEIKSMAMKFRWVDDIDAHSLREYNWSTDSIAQGILEGIVGDLVFDKLLNADFWIHVNLRDLPTSDKFMLTPKGDVTRYAE